MARNSVKGDLSPWLADELGEALARSRVPGAALGVFRQGQCYEGTAGTADLETGAAVGQGTCFQVGSITKLFTSALVLRLADQGRMDLDAPLLLQLPELAEAAWDASAITPRHLMSHTSGIEGELHPGVREDNHTVASYVDLLAGIPPFHAPGERFSYCNNGFMVAARLIETAAEMSWHEVMRAQILAPLGLDDVALVPGEAASRSRARGYAPKHDGTDDLVRPPEEFALPVCCGPVGTTPMMSASELVTFAASVFLGRGPAILSPERRHAFVRPEVRLPQVAACSVRHWGLGSAICDWNGARIVGHDGDTTTFLAYLRADPRSGTAVALLTNGGNANDLAHDVFSTVFGRLSNVAPPAMVPVVDGGTVADSDRFVGTYAKRSQETKISLEDDHLFMHAPPLSGPLYRESEHIFQFRCAGQRAPVRIEFGDVDERGTAQTIFRGYRLSRRALEPDPPEDPIHV